MAPSIHLFDIYRSSNIGIFLKANDKFCLVPRGLARAKSERISKVLQCEPIPSSISGSRLLGPLAALNNNGMILSRLAEQEEVEYFRKITGLRVERLDSRYTSVGNLISANDFGAVISDVFSDESARSIERVLGVPVSKMRLGPYAQVGSMISATNSGALVHPIASEEEINLVAKILKVEPEPATVNGGVPFVSSGFVGNSKGLLLGSQTKGSELVIIGRAFSL